MFDRTPLHDVCQNANFKGILGPLKLALNKARFLKHDLPFYCQKWPEVGPHIQQIPNTIAKPPFGILSQEPLDAPFLNELFSRGFSRAKMAH